MVDRLTGQKRADFFAKRSFEQYIRVQQGKNRMNSLELINGIPKGLRRIERFGLPKEGIALRKALFISRRSAKLADATVDARVGIDVFEKMDPKEKAALWDQFYEKAISFLGRRPEVREDPDLSKQLVFLQNFFSLPKKIDEVRARHWKIIEKIITRLTGNHIDPKENHLQELDRLVGKAKAGNSDIRALAMDICVASSIYADMKNKEGKSWSEAYQDGMELAYPKIKDFPEIVETIATL